MEYREIAINAVKLAVEKQMNPISAWETCAKNEYPNSADSEKKGCPKNAFLSVCETGIIEGIPAGKYTMSIHNKRYSVNALGILAKDNKKSYTVPLLWKTVLQNEPHQMKRHNGQMNVILGLWEGGLVQGIKK